MSIATEQASFTPVDLLVMPDGKNYELVDGELVEKDASSLSSFVGGKIYLRLATHCDKNHLGWTFPADASFQVFPIHLQKCGDRTALLFF